MLPTDPDTGKEIKLFNPTIASKFECGGGGVSTAGDCARFTQMLLNRGTLDGARTLGRKTVEFVTTDHLGTRIAPGPACSPGPLRLRARLRRAQGRGIGSAGDHN